MSTENQPGKKIIRFKPDSLLATKTLAADMYENLCQPATELVVNAFDGAFRIRRDPVVDIKTYRKHPLSPEKPAIGFMDNGVGFTEEVRKDYGRMGRSARIGHGRHGIGRFSAFALSSLPHEEKYFYILSAENGEPNATLYHIKGGALFDQDFEGVEIKREDYPDLPKTGDFTQILIPAWNEGFTSAALVEYLRDNLPNTSWKVTVDGEKVEPLKLKILYEQTVPVIKGIPGQVRFSLGKNEDTRRPHTLWLVDGVTKRPVAKLSECKGIQLDPTFRTPTLFGTIELDNLEDWSSGSRTNLSPDFWRAEIGKKFKEVLNGFILPPARKILGTTTETSEDEIIHSCITDISSIFAEHFGQPETQDGESTEEEGGGGDRPPTKDRPTGTNAGTRKGGSGGSKGSKGSGSGTRKSGGTAGTDLGTVYLRIENVTYEVITYRSNSELPAEVREGSVIVVNTQHRAVEPHLKTNRLREVFLRILTEAHVANAYAAEANILVPLYNLMGVLGV